MPNHRRLKRRENPAPKMAIELHKNDRTDERHRGIEGCPVVTP